MYTIYCVSIISHFISVAQSCPTVCNRMDCSTPSFPVHHQLLELAQTHVPEVSDTIQPSISSSVLPFSSRLQSFPGSGSFPMSQFFLSGCQSKCMNKFLKIICFQTYIQLVKLPPDKAVSVSEVKYLD